MIISYKQLGDFLNHENLEQRKRNRWQLYNFLDDLLRNDFDADWLLLDINENNESSTLIKTGNGTIKERMNKIACEFDANMIKNILYLALINERVIFCIEQDLNVRQLRSVIQYIDALYMEFNLSDLKQASYDKPKSKLMSEELKSEFGFASKITTEPMSYGSGFVCWKFLPGDIAKE